MSSKKLNAFQDFQSDQIQRSSRKIFTAHYACRNAGLNLTPVTGTTNGFIFQIINSLIKYWGVRLTWFDCRIWSRAGMAKKCTKKRDARAELLFISLNLFLSCRRLRSFLKVSNIAISDLRVPQESEVITQYNPGRLTEEIRIEIFITVFVQYSTFDEARPFRPM